MDIVISFDGCSDHLGSNLVGPELDGALTRIIDPHRSWSRQMNDSSTVTGNTGLGGGGIYNDVGTVIMNDLSKVSGNTTGGNGGGIENAVGTVRMNDSSSVTGNTAAGSGGGIWNCDGGTLIGATDGGNVNSNTPDNIAACNNS